ncbi:PREDICTED: homeobox-DDT domain protein RLT1-like isoform X1 [Nicotiana attenuata]|uniref:Homeobox-ddt domain protein rlt1 n=1 Tax=Nicotiana attenuata TaxID=49451 RepID=A0A1J6HZX0_NICAT|nr:PREDICTED: homeobox-DDT domain protein RLT1-like isoform X1 [Nicotiana attenuata]OIS97819.1 homeobox-ddt domain protein rlt1 [Nicotiana attenuata]
MEDLCEVHSEDDKGHPEKNKKRIIKTRAQVEALEKLYEEHKYPTDEMKADLAESSGLTEKQISGWFCHRRLKDKRLSNGEIYANARQDRSSGVIQDHGSGFRQDSCGSTKQADDKRFDHREVESRRLTGPEFSTADVTYEVGTHFRGKSNRMDDASSRSSSSLRNECFSHNAESYDIATSRYISQNLPTDFKGVKPKNGPSGYLKVKGQVENAAITAVKRQLGRHYRLDGPALGVEFDPLPPGAFESSVPNPVNDPYYSTEPVPDCSPDMSNVYRRSNGYGSNSKSNSHDSDLDGLRFKRKANSALPEYHFNLKPKPNSSEHNEYPKRNSSFDTNEGSARKIAVDSRDSCKFMPKHGRAEIRASTGSSNGLRSPYVGKVNGEQLKPRFNSHSEVRLKAVEKEHFDRKPSDYKGINYHNFEGRELPKIVEKDHISGKRTAVDENHDLVRVKVPRHNETRVVHRPMDEVPDHQEYLRRAPGLEIPLQTNHRIRTAAEMRRSFSEDEETEETSSFED